MLGLVVVGAGGVWSGGSKERTLYSLRHTGIMFRLLYGSGINTLALARNARTSVEMIDRFYAKLLSGEMNIEMLQSKRNRKIKDGDEPTAEWIKKLIEQALTLTAMILSNKKHKAKNS